VRIVFNKLWGQPIYNYKDGDDEKFVSCLREKEAILSSPTWWEWTQLEEWGYSVGISVDGNDIYRSKQVEYPDLEMMGLSDSEVETDSDVDHGGGNSSGTTALTNIVRSALRNF
jgi:hypothetical protein